VLAAKHYLCVFANASEVAALRPDMAALAALPLPAVIATAPADRVAAGRPIDRGGDAGAIDFVSRFFAPANAACRKIRSRASPSLPCALLGAGSKKSSSDGSFRRAAASSPARTVARRSVGGSAAVFLEGRIAV
jgi:hypothetical protein